MTQCCLMFAGSNGRMNASPAAQWNTHLHHNTIKLVCTTLQGAATSQTYWHDPIVIACLFLKFPDNRCNRFPALLRDTNIVTVLHTQTTENNLAELLLLREVLPLQGRVLSLLRRVLSMLRDTNIVTVLHTQTTENNLAELLLLREVLPLMGQVLPLLRQVLSLLRDTNIVTVLHTHSVFFVDDNENDDENDEIVSNFRRRD